MLFRAEELGDDDRAADVRADGDGHEDHGDGVGGADGGDGVLAVGGEAAGDGGVGHVVELLEDDADEKGEGELAQHLFGLALGEVFDHGGAFFLW